MQKNILFQFFVERPKAGVELHFDNKSCFLLNAFENSARAKVTVFLSTCGSEVIIELYLGIVPRFDDELNCVGHGQ